MRCLPGGRGRAKVVAMIPRTPDDWQASKGLARGILHDRALRRKAIARVLALLLAVFAIGLWVIPEWLQGNLWRFVLWWGGCGLLSVFLVVFAFYDLLRVIREEREDR
jgi:hypothetical protein